MKKYEVFIVEQPGQGLKQIYEYIVTEPDFSYITTGQLHRLEAAISENDNVKKVKEGRCYA